VANLPPEVITTYTTTVGVPPPPFNSGD